jgi:hypothetical protein
MWIIPKQLHTSAFVPDTAALSLDSTELSEICARSLFVRSKPSAARTWSQKWNRDSWTQHLSGRILNPSHGQSFVTAWTSFLLDIHASHFQPPESASAPKTQDTSGHLSQTEFGFCDQVSVSLKMSKDTSRWDSPASSATWKSWVTKCRGEYSARLKSVRLTSGSEFSSWPTPQAQDTQRTPEAYAAAREKRGGKMFLSLNIAAQLHGQAAPASSSSLGSRQGLWPTITAHTPDMESSGPNGHAGTYLAGAVKSWGTPRACEWKGGNMTTQAAIDREVAHNNLVGQVATSPNPGKLNPRWVETLMGLPVGWVMPSCKSPVTIEQTNCASSATESSLQQPSEHSELFGRNSND